MSSVCVIFSGHWGYIKWPKKEISR